MGYVAFAKSPRNRFRAPTVPAPDDATKPGSCQHSRTEAPSRAEMAVRLREGVVMLESWLCWAVAAMAERLMPRRDRGGKIS